MPMATFHTAENSERLHGLDAVRATALLLGIVLHTALSFLPGARVWVVMDVDRSLALAITVYVIHMFRMVLFFLVAGFFAHLSFHRLGRAAFIRDRLRRIAVPLVVAWPIMLVSVAAILAWAAGVAGDGGAPAGNPRRPTFMPDDFPLLHLWFLWVLLLLYGATLGIRAVIDALDQNQRLRAVADRVVRFVINRRAPLWLALPLALALYTQETWYVERGIPMANHSLYANVPSWVAYGSAFALGWMVHRQPDLLDLWRRRWGWNVALALVSTTACLAVLWQDMGPTLAEHDWVRLAYAGCFAVGAWSWSFAIAGIGLRFRSGFSSFWRYIADASFWVYLIHLPIIMVLQVVVARLHWPWIVKFPLIMLVGGAVMFLSYQWLVRYTAIGALLSGRRRIRMRPEIA